MRRGIGFTLTALLVVAAGLRIGQFLWVAFHRVSYPFELEWLEGDLFHHALRIHKGLAWYPKPSVEFFPAFYPPGYPMLCSLLMNVLGENLTTLRVVSIAATLTAGAIMVLLARREGGSVTSGVAGAGLFFASYAMCGSWLDVGRVDSLALALALLGTLLAGRRSGSASYYAGILALALSAWVKQNHLAFLVATILVWWVWDWKRALGGLVVGAAIVGAPFVALQASSHGWFSFYVITLPEAATRDWDKVRSFWLEGPLRMAGLALPALAWACFSPARTALPILLIPVAALVSLAGWSQGGGYLNNFIPVVAFLAVGIGIGLGQLKSSPPRSAAVSWAIQALVLAQLAWLRYDVGSNLPTRSDVAEGWKVVEEVKTLPTPILAPYHPYLLHLAGLDMGMHFHTFNEVAEAREHGRRLDDGGLGAEIERLLRERHWATYIGIEDEKRELITPIDRLALRRGLPYAILIAPGDSTTLFPLTGNRVRPGLAYWLQGNSR